jgi:hypothetical protein
MEQKWTYWLWGMAIGAALCAIVGMSWGGWETRSSARILAQKQVNAALVKVLTPICIAKFQAAENAPVRLAELKKIGTTWARESFVREGKWAENGSEQSTPVVDACADALYRL